MDFDMQNTQEIANIYDDEFSFDTPEYRLRLKYERMVERNQLQAQQINTLTEQVALLTSLLKEKPGKTSPSRTRKRKRKRKRRRKSRSGSKKQRKRRRMGDTEETIKPTAQAMNRIVPDTLTRFKNGKIRCYAPTGEGHRCKKGCLGNDFFCRSQHLDKWGHLDKDELFVWNETNRECHLPGDSYESSSESSDSSDYTPTPTPTPTLKRPKTPVYDSTIVSEDSDDIPNTPTRHCGGKQLPQSNVGLKQVGNHYY